MKTRWKLTVIRRERTALLRTARGCRNVMVRVWTSIDGDSDGIACE